MTNAIIALLCYGAVISTASSATIQKDLRPKFDKTTYMKSCWSQANPWWRPSRSCRYGAGGPDYAWNNFPKDEKLMWQKVAEVCKPYGLSGVQFEVTLERNGSISWQKSFKNAADGFQAAGNGFKTSLFVSVHKGPENKAVEQFENLFKKLWPTLKNHPAVYRLNGAPVLIIYTPATYSPETWHKMVTNVEKKYGKIIILANAWTKRLRESPEVLREYLKVFDGISAYANWTDAGQRKFHAMASKIMHEEFPYKIFEASVHNTYTVHFHYGGTIPDLNEKYLKSWTDTIASKPDAIVITNFFDIYENSRIFPSYELDDVLLRTAQYHLDKWRGKKTSKRKGLDVYVSNFTNVLLGQPALFEVLSFPAENQYSKLSLTLEICDAKGKILHTFPSMTLKQNTIDRKVFKLDSLEFADKLALLPKVKIQSRNYKQVIDSFPPTMLVAGMRAHLLWWSRSLRNMLNINKGTKKWSINTVTNGHTMHYPEYGLAVIQSDAISNSSGNWNQGGGTVRIMRNGREIQRKSQWSLDMAQSILLPDPISSLDWYNLELVNNHGCRYISSPIWISGDRYGKQVKLPVISNKHGITEININADRIPFFYYPCNFDAGPLLIDYSGYRHNGFLGGSGYGGGHLARTAYRHEHLGGLKKKKKINSPLFINDKTTGGYYRFNGNQYITIQGGTAFPYASTYEISIKPEKTGKAMGIIGAGNNQIQLSIDPQGYIIVERSSAIEAAGGQKVSSKISVSVRSKKAVKFGKWTRIAAVYDLKNLSLYLDGELQDRKSIAPMSAHEMLNVVIIGGKCRNVWQPYQYYSGDIKKIRIYGRDLSPDEFLKSKKI